MHQSPIASVTSCSKTLQNLGGKQRFISAYAPGEMGVVVRLNLLMSEDRGAVRWSRTALTGRTGVM